MVIEGLGSHKLYMYFDSLTDIKSYLKQREKQIATFSDTHHGCRDYFKTRIYFDTIDEDLLKAYKSAANIDEKFKAVKDRILIKYKNDVIGQIPNVPNFVMGLPQSMIRINKERVKTSSKIVNILIDGDISWKYTQEQIQDRLISTLKVVDEIEAEGFRVNLYWASWTYDTDRRGNKKEVYTFIKLKSASEPLDVNKVLFPLCNRNFVWDIFCVLLQLLDGYEDATYFDKTSIDKLQEEFKQRFEQECFGLSFNLDTDDLDKLRKKVREYNESK